MKIKEYYQSDLSNLIKAKMIVLAKDAGTRFAEDEIRHIAERMPELLSEKFGHIDFDECQKAWDKGSTGGYGMATKINVNNLVSWIYARIRENQEANRHNSDAFKYIEWDDRFVNGFGEFVCWLRRECGIYPQDIEPDSENFNLMQKVSPKLKEMEVEYVYHKTQKTLESYRNMLVGCYVDV